MSENELLGSYPVVKENLEEADVETNNDGPNGGLVSPTTGISGGPGAPAEGSRGITENMGASAASGTPAWVAADFRVLISEFLGPCATTGLVLGIMENLGIGSVSTFNQIFQNMSDGDVRFCVCGQLGMFTMPNASYRIFVR